MVEVWATVEGQEDVGEAMRLDAVDEMTTPLNGTPLDVENVSEDKKEDGGGESRVGGREARGGGSATGLRYTFGVLRPPGEGSG